MVDIVLPGILLIFGVGRFMRFLLNGNGYYFFRWVRFGRFGFLATSQEYSSFAALAIVSTAHMTDHSENRLFALLSL